MADTVKRGVLLKELATTADVQKHVMKDSASSSFDTLEVSRHYYTASSACNRESAGPR